MTSLGRIIVGVEQHDAAGAAVALGARLAGWTGGPLELFTPVYNSHVSLAHFENRERLQHARDQLVQRHVDRLEQLAAGLAPGLAVESQAAWDHPFEEALIRRVLDRAADLLVVMLPAGEGPGGRPLSSAHWQLVRNCPAPVLLTRGRAWRERPVIVAAVDPTGRHGRSEDLDVRILQVAGTLADEGGGTLHAFHAWQRDVRAMVGEMEAPFTFDLPEEETERRHREFVYEALGAADAAPARVSLVEGRPEAVLPEYCDETGADLVIMGAIARNALGRIFIGSTAERVLDQLPCDLLVVKPDAFRTPVPRERWPRDESVTPLGVPGI